eukprot:CAMPEP_0206061222 /NCGR_PEP_ID=MMETSP1466-20131121/53562_1 /ASSEMBLY_ACC=CAM_ASM_001126 /TAXON_ID=44452 /ORGANISM="Pavlova gyrans, Strain CCMP608" /LENGTH=239 /DNA_ID=CAMNT_0053436571 /DNA_START=31 /DNA_END=748 /DNA_ORIENTATION=-
MAAAGAYHSSFKEEDAATFAGGCAVLPIRTTCRGPAPALESGAEDIIDEAIYLFKANVLFRNFEVKGPADRLLVYLTLYISECLRRIEGARGKAEALKALTNMALEAFPIPGDASFPLGPYFPTPESKQEADFIRSYLRQLREETGRRMIDKCYPDGETTPSKWWIAFSKRRFMNKASPDACRRYGRTVHANECVIGLMGLSPLLGGQVCLACGAHGEEWDAPSDDGCTVALTDSGHIM